MPCGYDAEIAHREAEMHRDELAAVGAGEVVAVDAAAYFSRPGPRIIDGLELLAHIIHPELSRCAREAHVESSDRRVDPSRLDPGAAARQSKPMPLGVRPVPAGDRQRAARRSRPRPRAQPDERQPTPSGAARRPRRSASPVISPPTSPPR